MQLINITTIIADSNSLEVVIFCIIEATLSRIIDAPFLGWPICKILVHKLRRLSFQAKQPRKNKAVP